MTESPEKALFVFRPPFSFKGDSIMLAMSGVAYLLYYTEQNNQTSTSFPCFMCSLVIVVIIHGVLQAMEVCGCQGTAACDGARDQGLTSTFSDTIRFGFNPRI